MTAMHTLPASQAVETFSWPIRVYWEDTDAGGIVFYANYLKYFERARTEWLRARGLEQRHIQNTLGGIFVVSEAHIKYLRSARLDDQLMVTARLHDLGRTSFTIQQEASLQAQIPGGEIAVLCTGSVRIGWVNQGSMKPARIPPLVQIALQR
jgi:acyl-CoA thioester hydrolase